MLGNRLKKLREESGKTQEEISSLLNIARGTYAHYELGKRKPDYETLQKLADLFNVSTDYLLGRSNNTKNAEHMVETKASHNLDISGLPEEAIKQVEEYIELIKLKYNPNGTRKG